MGLWPKLKITDSYLKWVIWCSRNFKANMFVRFQMIAMAQFIVFLSIVQIKCSMTKKTFYFEAFRFWRHDLKQIYKIRFQTNIQSCKSTIDVITK